MDTEKYTAFAMHEIGSDDTHEDRTYLEYAELYEMTAGYLLELHDALQGIKASDIRAVHSLALSTARYILLDVARGARMAAALFDNAR